jgi:hypothetical protein
MEKAIELARGTVAAEHSLIIHLIRDSDTNREVLVITWPPQPTEIEPRRLAKTTTAVVVVLAEARVQLAAIRKAER